MQFIELTEERSGYTIHVRANSITRIISDGKKDEPCTAVFMGGLLEHVKETPEEVLRRIKDLERKETRSQNEILRRISSNLSYLVNTRRNCLIVRKLLSTAFRPLYSFSSYSHGCVRLLFGETTGRMPAVVA